MIIQVPEGAPLIIKAAAAALLLGHIGGGTVALASGAVAMAARKGQRLHRAAGQVFFISMLSMAGSATVASFFLPDKLLILISIFTLYLTVTAWQAGRRRPDPAFAFERRAFVAGGLIALAMFLTAGVAAMSAGGAIGGYTYPLPLVIGGIATLGAAMDLRVVRLGGLVGPARLARHVWRISTAFFIASGSFFLGQQNVMPEAVRGSPVLMVLGLAPLGLMIFWLVRIRLLKATRRAAAAA